MKGRINYFISFGSFLLLYMVGILLPLEVTPHYGNYMSRVWNWTEILILFCAAYYTFKARIFQLQQAVTALLLGAVCLAALFRDPRTTDILMTSVCVMMAFYAACRLYDLADVENVSLHQGIWKSVCDFGLGALISVPLAFLNVLYFSFSRQVHVENVLHCAVFALKPAISEEVVFRFFLLAYGSYLLHGITEKRFQNALIDILLIFPHELLHYPDMFLQSPFWAVAMCILGSLFFGLPMAACMRRKNLQMAVGMHWFIDFVRFTAGF